jgi:hypothetical protein
VKKGKGFSLFGPVTQNNLDHWTLFLSVVLSVGPLDTASLDYYITKEVLGSVYGLLLSECYTYYMGDRDGSGNYNTRDIYLLASNITSGRKEYGQFVINII